MHRTGGGFCPNAYNFTQSVFGRILIKLVSNFLTIRQVFISTLLQNDCGKLAENQRLSVTSSSQQGGGGYDDLELREVACRRGFDPCGSRSSRGIQRTL